MNTEKNTDEDINKYRAYRIIAFLALWILSFYIVYSISIKQSDITATYIGMNIWQVFLVVPLYILIDKRLAKKSSFQGRTWMLPLLGLLVASIVFVPLGYLMIFGGYFLGAGVSYLVR